MALNLDLSYVPTARERRRAVMSPWFVRLHYAGLAGGVLAVVGGDALLRAAERHGETPDAASLATLAGVLLLAYPVMVSLWTFHAQLRQRTEWPADRVEELGGFLRSAGGAASR